MKKQVVTLALTTFLGLGTVGIAAATPQQAPPTPAASEGQGHRTPDPNRQMQMLAKRLSLTADQQSQLLPILSSRQQQIETIKADSSLSLKERHAKMRAIREDSEGKIRAMLNDDQRQAYDQFRQEQRERMQQHREQHQNGAGPSA